jgi:protein phosphatase 1L
MKSAVVIEQGKRNYHMEDTYFLDLNFGKQGRWIVGGVYNGHRGEIAAQHLAKSFHGRFFYFLYRFPSIADAFTNSYESISEELNHQDSGSCAANFFIKNKKIHFANVGDVEIIIVQKDTVCQLTTNHRLSNTKERDRIKEMGGEIHDNDPYVYRGANGLMPTRTIGDPCFKEVGIIARPTTGSHKISKNDLFLITASDGLFDKLNKNEVAEIARKFKDPEKIAKALKEEVFNNHSAKDDLTIIVLSLN